MSIKMNTLISEYLFTSMTKMNISPISLPTSTPGVVISLIQYVKKQTRK